MACTLSVSFARCALVALGTASLLACGSEARAPAGASGSGTGGAAEGGGSTGNGGGPPSNGATGGASSGGGAAGNGSAGSGGTTAASGCAAHPDAVYCNDFDDAPVGPYTEQQLRADWNEPSWNDGVAEGRVSVVDGADAFSGNALAVRFPQGAVGPNDGGAQWHLVFPQPYEELYFAYRVRFQPGFEFVRGGKLPGLTGGKDNTGCTATRDQGWSARNMWRRNGADPANQAYLVQYVYDVDRPENCGDNYVYDLGAPRLFVPDQWYLIEHRVVMNTPGVADGVLQGWFDGVLAVERTDVQFRASGDDSLAITSLYFSTFFGGSGADWAPTRDETVFFDDIVVSTSPITH